MTTYPFCSRAQKTSSVSFKRFQMVYLYFGVNRVNVISPFHNGVPAALDSNLSNGFPQERSEPHPSEENRVEQKLIMGAA